MASKRKAIKAAIVAQVANITVANGYSVDIGDISDVEKSVSDIAVYPSVQWVYGRETKNQAELHRTEGTLDFFGILYAKGDDADDTLDDFAADIEKNLETQTGGVWLSLGYVYDVRITAVDPWEVDEATSRGVRVWVVTVVVRYRYTRAQP